MKRCLAIGAIAVMTTTMSLADILYMTGYGTTARYSTDGGVTWSTFVDFGSGRYRGGTCDSYGNVFFINRDGGTQTARPLYAYSPSGSLIATTTFDSSGMFNQLPIGYFKGYVYVNDGSAGGSGIEDGSTSWDGSTFGSNPLGPALNSEWQANDMAFASYGGTDYQFVNGTSGTALRRRVVVGNGTLSSQTAVTPVPTSGSLPSTWGDLAFSANGRFVLLGMGTTGWEGIWLSGVNSITATAPSVTRVFAFSGTENPATGDMGPNARDMVMLGNTIYAVSDTRLYIYTLDDVNGTVTFVNSYVHGFNNNSVQIGAIPEPSTLALAGVGLLVLLLARRRR